MDTITEDKEVEELLYLLTFKHKYVHPNRDKLREVFNLNEDDTKKMRLRYLKSRLKDAYEVKSRRFSAYYNTKLRYSDKQFIMEYIKDSNKSIKSLEMQIKYIDNADRGQVDLAELKKIPIPKLLESWGIEMKRDFFSIRKEAIPSAKYYAKTNSFFDHGTQKGGSNIDLVMAHEDCELSKAIKHLTNSG